MSKKNTDRQKNFFFYILPWNEKFASKRHHTTKKCFLVYLENALRLFYDKNIFQCKINRYKIKTHVRFPKILRIANAVHRSQNFSTTTI